MGLIRLLLALAVLLSHIPAATVHFIGGGTAVQAFFVVSGFYMSLVLSGKYRDRRTFWTNRLLRLAPAYAAMMLIAGVALAGWGLTATATPQIFASAFSHPSSAAILAFENIAVIGQHWLYWFKFAEDGSLYFDPSGGLPTATAKVGWQALIVPQSWSLSIELIFYALVPWLVRLRSRTLIALALASIALRLLGYALPVDFGLWQGRLFSTALFLFLFGMLAHRALPRVQAWPVAVRFTGFALLIAVIVFLPLAPLPAEAMRWIVYVAMALGTPIAFSLTRNNRLDRWIGELSYPIYLSQLFTVALVLTMEWPWPSWTAIMLTLALSAAIMMLVERPVDRWRQRRAQRALSRSTQAVTSIVVPSTARASA
ncbi:MAG: acyltransferase [Sphingobium sp.]|nr:acyltransferase [Sphingobium sp.]